MDWPALKDIVVGLSVTDMVGIKAMVALAVLAGSTTLVAVIVMVC